MLIEREEVLQRLRAMARQAAQGQGATALLIGEAGIGKSALLQAFSACLAGAAGPGRLLQGGCEDLFTSRALGPLRDMAPMLGPQLAHLLDGEAESGALFARLLDWLRNAPGLTVLVFEDVHWADQATLDLLKYLARRAANLRLLLLASVRSDELDEAHPFWRWVGDLPAASTERLVLAPLSREGVAELAAASGRDGEELYRITAGNPFFVSELLAAGCAEGGLPLSVRDAVWTRMARLDEGERALLELHSVSPVPCEDWLLEAVLGPSAQAACDRCVTRGLLLATPARHTLFRHELARLAVASRISPARQRELHGRLCAALCAPAVAPRQVALARLVHHAAAAQDAARVLAWAPRAAQEAARLGAHRQAAAHLATALRFVGAATPAPEAARLQEEWSYEAGLVCIDDAVIAARQRAIALWRGLGRSDKVGFNLRWLSRLHWYRGEAEQAARYGMEAIATLEQLPHSRELAMAYSLRSQHEMLQDHPQQALEWGTRALALADALGDTETRIHALNNLGTTRLFAGLAGGQAQLEESLALALRHGYHEHAARCYTNLSEYAVTFRQFALAERLLADGIAFDSEHDLDAWTHYLVGWQAQLRMEQGRLQDAQRIAGEVLALPQLTLMMRLPAQTVLARVRARQGAAGAGALLEQALADALATGEAQRAVPVYLGLVEYAWLGGQAQQARAWLAALRRLDLAGLNVWERGGIAVWAGRLRAGALAGGPWPAPYEAELAGQHGAAADAWLALGLPYEAGLALLASAAPACLARAVSLLEPLEARPAAQLARAQAQAQGQALPRARRGPYGAARSHPQGLTRREAQILALLLDGCSNADIARRLVRSPRTVEHHVSALLDKLGVHSRQELLRQGGGQNWVGEDGKLGGLADAPAARPR